MAREIATVVRRCARSDTGDSDGGEAMRQCGCGDWEVFVCKKGGKVVVLRKDL
jgi:hypothetical protein